MGTKIAVLVSAGRHPTSGRPRRAPGDARALELALRLTPSPLVVHAGDPGEPALRDYLGMGIGALTVLECPGTANPIPCLAAELALRRPRLILTGMRAEHGPGTGYLPYAVAEALGAAVAPAILGITPAEDGLHLAQALPGGRRRGLWTAGPVLATVDRAAPPPRPSAFGPARRGRILARAPAGPLPEEARPESHPARKRPRRLRVSGGTAAERQAALRGAPEGDGHLLADCTPREAALAIYRQLLQMGLLHPAGAASAKEEEPADHVAP